MANLYVVFCIDTEGPYTDPKYYDPSQLLGSWEKIDEVFLSKVFSKKFRYAYPDSDNQPVKLSWFFLNWSGYRTFPVEHDVGYHKVFDRYEKVYGKQIKLYHDEKDWHYHHPSLSGIGNEWGTNWLANREYENVLCRMLIDRSFFPSVYRAGGTIEDNDQSHWLEQWIPFDFSNRHGKEVQWNRPEADGRSIIQLCDWSKAPDDWSTYHPDWEHFNQIGKMNRQIAKSLDLKSGAHTLTKPELRKAFNRVKSGKDTIFSIFEHDFRDRSADLIQAMQWIHEISVETNVKFYYMGANEAMKQINKYPTKNNFKLTITKTLTKLRVKSNQPLFNSQPFLAIKYSKNIYRWQPMFKTDDLIWEYSFLPEDINKKIGVGAHDKTGNTFTKVLVL